MQRQSTIAEEFQHFTIGKTAIFKGGVWALPPYYGNLMGSGMSSPSLLSDDQVIVASSSQSEVVFCATIYWKREVGAQSRFVSCWGCIFVQSRSLLPSGNVSDCRRREDEDTVSVLFKILICFDKLWHSITINRRDKTPPRQNLATGEGRAMNSFNSLINITS